MKLGRPSVSQKIEQRILALRSTGMRALGPHPEARQAVVQALRELEEADVPVKPNGNGMKVIEHHAH